MKYHCNELHPDTKTQCNLAPNHEGDHKRNGLVWGRVKMAIIGTVPPVPTWHDPINHPTHYTSHPSGVECIQIVEHMNFNRGNAIKYVWRAGEKGPVEEDLRKAIWYLEREIKRLVDG
jgi:hypothetical protein